MNTQREKTTDTYANNHLMISTYFLLCCIEESQMKLKNECNLKEKTTNTYVNNHLTLK